MGGGGFTAGRPATRRSTSSSWRSRGRPVPRDLLPADRQRRPARPDRRASTSAFGDRPCEPSVLSLFRLGRRAASTCASICSRRTSSTSAAARCATCWRSGASTGSTRSCARRGTRGVVLAGLSAGAMCWFEGGITKSRGPAAARRRASGCSRASLSVHSTASPSACRLPRRGRAGSCPGATRPDDGAACCSATAAARARRVVASRRPRGAGRGRRRGRHP